MATDVVVKGDGWDTHMANSLQKMRDDKILCDVLVIGKGGREFQAHSAVLGAASSYLGSLLSQARRETFVMKTEIDDVVWDLILKFIYRSQATVSSGNVSDLQAIAQELQLEQLVKACRNEDNELTETVLPTQSPARNVATTDHEQGQGDMNTQDSVPEIPHDLANQYAVEDNGVIDEDGDGSVPEIPHDLAKRYAIEDDGVIDEERDDDDCGTMNIADGMEIDETSILEKNVGASEDGNIVHPKLERTEPIIEELSMPASPFATKGRGRPKGSKNKKISKDGSPKAASDTSDGKSKKRIRCNICPLLFSTEEGLEKHRMKRHDGQTEKKAPKTYVCSICGKESKSRTLMFSHEAGHHGEKPFPCDLCGGRYQHRSTLLAHKRSCAGLDGKGNRISISTHLCQICGQSFFSPKGYQMHQLRHTGEKPFKCHTCDKHFRKISNCRLHEKIHEGIRPYSCRHCSKTFIDSSNLKRHLRIHTGEKPYVCKYCPSAFTQSGTLKAHYNKHHSIEMHAPQEPSQVEEKSIAVMMADGSFFTSDGTILTTEALREMAGIQLEMQEEEEPQPELGVIQLEDIKQETTATSELSDQQIESLELQPEQQIIQPLTRQEEVLAHNALRHLLPEGMADTAEVVGVLVSND